MVKTSVEQNSHYFDENTNTVITCFKDSSTCILEDPSIKGYFINSDTEDKANKIIKCYPASGKTSNCEKVANVDSCNKAGCIKVDNTSNPNSVILCLNSSCANSDELIVMSNSEAYYKTIDVSNENDFPGSKVGAAVIKIGKDGSVILLEDTGLPACVEASVTSGNSACFAGAVDGQYCIHSDKAIYKTEGSKCTTLTGTEEGTKPIYFNNVFEKVDVLEETSNYIMAYLCSFNSNNQHAVKSCEFVKGYVVDNTNSKYIQCNGWQREGCEVNSIPEAIDSCNGEGIFNIIQSDGKVICFGTNKYSIPTLEPDYIVFKTNEINPIYGSKKDNILFLSLSTAGSFNSVIVTKHSGKILIINK